MLISDLIAKRAQLETEHEALEAKATAEKRTAFSAEELKRSKEIEGEIQSIDDTIARLKRKQELALRGEEYAKDQPEADKPDPEARTKPPLIETPSAGADKSPFRSFGEQMQAIARLSSPSLDTRTREQYGNKLDVCTRAALGQNEATNTDGGFAVHPEYVAGIQKRMFEVGQISGRVNWQTLTNGNQLIINALEDDKRTLGNRSGGVRVYMGNEAEAATKAKIKLRQIKVDLKKMIGIYYATDEVLEDAPALGQLLSDGFSDEIAYTLDEQIITGDGNMQLKGFLSAGSAAMKVKISKETGQDAASIVYMNVLKMYARSTQGPGLLWLANRDTLPNLATMNLAIGTAGVPVWLPAGGASGQPGNTLFGYPLVFVEQAETVGTEGDLMLIDLSRYMGVKKGGVRMDSSIHVQFLTGEQTFRLSTRVGGQPWDDKVITPAKGSATISPFVTLETRA